MTILLSSRSRNARSGILTMIGIYAIEGRYTHDARFLPNATRWQRGIQPQPHRVCVEVERASTCNLVTLLLERDYASMSWSLAEPENLR